MTLLEMTLSGGVMILAIAALRALTLRRLPKAAFTALWWAAALRLLIPVELPSRLSVYTLLESLRPKAAPVPAPVPAVPSPRPAPVLIIPSQTAAVPAPAPKPFPLWTVLWAVGAAALALWFLVRYIRWRRRFRESLPADCPGLEDCLRARRRVRLRVTDQIAAPLTYGLLRPVILLPRTLDLGDQEAAACVLAHEMAHIRRLDSLLKLVLTAALCLHWFNPAVWLLYVLANRDMELCCDEAAVLSLGEDSRERYALALLRLAELRNECVPLCGFSHKSGMEERIRAIMSIQKKSLLACFAALALVLGITTAFATSARPAEADEPLGYDMADRELHAQLSAESAAQWKEALAPYEPFGLKWAFDDPDLDGNGLTMTWEGREVRGIYDQEKALWITEHTGNGAYGPDAVELYAVYEGKALTGLRLATEEEQARFDQDRKLSADALKVENLVESVRYDSGNIYFTIPESEEPWSIFIQGRILLEDGSGMSVHYLQEESEQAEWVPRMTYSFEAGDAAFDELTMDIRYGDASYSYPLTLLLPEGNPLAAEPLRSGKADIPEGAEMIWPVDGGTISQAQGTRANPGGEGERTHNGVDIAVERGTPVYAAGKGTVKEAGFNAQDGNFVRIDHGNGQETFYAHCDSLQVEAGDAVELGQTIATVGSTGLSTGPHLHFEFLVDGVATDPLVFEGTNERDARLNLFSASWGRFHGEEQTMEGNPIIAIQDGTILAAGVRDYGVSGMRGPYVQISYQSGYSMTFYGCKEVVVKTGDRVKMGDMIAYSDAWASGYGPVPIEETESELDVAAEWKQWADKNLVNGDYPRNRKGETYGSYKAYEYLGYEPDLMEVENSTGMEGYVATKELNFPDFGAGTELYAEYAEEARAYDNWVKENQISRVIIPMYDEEHNTIGEWDHGVLNGVPRGKTITYAELVEASKKGWPNANGSQDVYREPEFKSIEEAQEALRNGWPDYQ